MVLSTRSTFGYTLLELMMVVTIIAVVAIIAYPTYQNYVMKTNRTQMMVELQNIAKDMQSQRLIQGRNHHLDVSTLFRKRIPESTSIAPNNSAMVVPQYPYTGDALYTLSIEPLTANGREVDFTHWTLIATPIAQSRMSGDGILSLNHKGKKCHQEQCSYDDSWLN